MRAEGVQTLAIDGVESIAPVSTTTVVSDGFLLSDVIKMGLELIATGTTVNILIKLLISQDNTNLSIEDGYANIANIQDGSRHRYTILDAAIPAAKYGKLQFVGIGANAADVAVTGNINLIREQVNRA